MQQQGAHPSSIFWGLSARLLVLTVFFVMLAEVLIYAPSIARYRRAYLEDHIIRGHLATLALEATPDNMVSLELERKLLRHADAAVVALHHANHRLLALKEGVSPSVDVTFDLRRTGIVDWIGDAFETLIQDRNRIMRVIGISPKDQDTVIDIIINETPMREAMYGYSTRILQLSVVISLITAGLVFFSLQWLMVVPMRHLTSAMTAFRENPEDATTDIVAGTRSDEIGIARRELAAMQDDIRSALRQKTRLATLGAAVAKINHDLRNSLATAVLVSDKLSNIEDPEVKRVTPRLYDAIDHAVDLCSQTLNYVGDSDPEVRRELFHIYELVEEVRAEMRPAEGEEDGFTVRNELVFEMSVEADRRQMFRVLANLARNAKQAGATTFTVRATEHEDRITIDAVDDGPGLEQKARDKLFQPFAGSARKGGTGLGLVICRDIMQAHGGDLKLVEAGAKGTLFRLILPNSGS